MNFRSILTTVLVRLLHRLVRIVLIRESMGPKSASRVPRRLLSLRNILTSMQIRLHLRQRLRLVPGALQPLPIRPLGHRHVCFVIEAGARAPVGPRNCAAVPRADRRPCCNLIVLVIDRIERSLESLQLLYLIAQVRGVAESRPHSLAR